ncbi:MAG: hypothetical protein ACE3JK_15430 [Sporolactobacillus sp.]
MNFLYRHKIVTAIFLILIIFIILIGTLYYFAELGSSEDWENGRVSKDINQLITDKNKKEITRISTDNKTEKFLLGLKKGAKVENTSGFEGQTADHLDYYGAEIAHRNFDIYIYPEKEKNIIDHIFPKYEIKEISIR